MKVLLIHPPGAYLDMPPLGLACLQASLKEEKDLEVSIWDSNVDFFYFLLESKNLLLQKERIQKENVLKENILRQKIRLKLFSRWENIVPKALKVFQDSKLYYQLDQHDWASGFLKNVMDFYSSETEPFSFFWDENGFRIYQNKEKISFTIPSLFSFLKEKKSFFWLDQFSDSTLPSLLEKSFDVIAFSCPNPQQFLPLLFLAREIKRRNPKATLLLGGSFITVSRRLVCNSPEVHKLFKGIITFEGEKAFSQFLQGYRGEIAFAQISNFSFTNKKNEIVHTDLSQILDLNTLPTPDFSNFPLERYLTPEVVLPSYSSRGCFYDLCSFCAHHGNYFGKFRLRSPQKVVEDFKRFKDLYSSTKIFFTDEVFPPLHHMKLAQTCMSQNIKVNWYAHSRVEKKLPKDWFETLSKGGATLLHVGLESANSRVLRLMNKGYSRLDVIRFLQKLQKASLTSHLNLIQGFPGEKPEEYLQSLETVLKFKKKGDFIHLYMFSLDLGSDMEKKKTKFFKILALDSESLDRHLSFEKIEVEKETLSQKRKKMILANLVNSFDFERNRLFPKGCSWASNLLYVSWYRNTNQDERLDQIDTIETIYRNPKVKFFLSPEMNSRVYISFPRTMEFLEIDHENEKQRFVFKNNIVPLWVSEATFRLLNNSKGKKVLWKDIVKGKDISSHQTLRQLLILIKEGVLEIEEG